MNQKNKIQDEASLFVENNLIIKFIKGENSNSKITYNEDIKTNRIYFGIGFEIHRLIKGKNLYLGGLKIPYHSGLKGHSDGDVIIHSIIDALLGAMRKKDIGTLFPDNKKKFKNMRSTKLLKPIIKMMNKNKFYINNIDITSRANADEAMFAMSDAIDQVNSQRALLGASMSRLEYASDNLQNVAQNTAAARSRVLDADYASETTELARTQIIQQAATAMLAQANQSQQSVLALLRSS